MQKKRIRTSFELTEHDKSILKGLVDAGIYQNASDALRDLIRKAEAMIEKGKFNNAHDLAKAEAGNPKKVRSDEGGAR